MNYSYLYINKLTGEEKTELFDQLKTSLRILKDLDPNHGSIHIFNNNDIDVLNLCKDQGCFLNNVSTTRNYGGIIDILIEKINVLKNFDTDQDITLLDIDTVLTKNIPEDAWRSDTAVLWSAEYYITQYRNLDKVLPLLPWNEIEIQFDSNYIMYNTGVVYIPKEHRKEICEKALWIADKLNDGTFNPEDRHGNKLDEQIGLSIAMHDVYGRFGKIKTCNDFIYHYWEEKAKGLKWWLKYE